MVNIICDCCHQPMKMVKQVKSKKGRNKHRIRRFYCYICDITTTIHADGVRDMVLEPLDASLKGGNINTPVEEDKLRTRLYKDSLNE